MRCVSTRYACVHADGRNSSQGFEFIGGLEGGLQAFWGRVIGQTINRRTLIPDVQFRFWLQPVCDLWCTKWQWNIISVTLQFYGLGIISAVSHILLGHAAGWGTSFQARRSRFRSSMVSLEFFIDIILPAALWPWGRLNP